MNSCNKHFPYALIVVLGLLTLVMNMSAAMAATAVSSISFVIDPALPEFDDAAADFPSIIGYASIPIGTSFLLPGGKALAIGVNDFDNPAARIGKFIFDPDDISSLFPIIGADNGLAAVALSVTMAITDLDTNEGESDYLDVIFALSLNEADDGSTLLRILTNQDAGTPITPQFLTGFGNQPIGDPPDIATNVYDLTVAPVLGSDLAKMFSESGGEIWLYPIDADDAGNRISLANSLAANFSLTISFAPAVIPLPPSLVMFASAAIAMVLMMRRRI